MTNQDQDWCHYSGMPSPSAYKRIKQDCNIFLCGGRLGDLVHNLLAIKSLYQQSGKKGILYITNDRKLGGDIFSYDIEKTYRDIKDFILHQDYIEEFHILKTGNLIREEFTNLNKWRKSRFCMKRSWIDIICDQHQIALYDTKWLDFDKDDRLKNTILIHRSLNPRRLTDNFPWDNILSKNNCQFVTCDPEEWNRFSYKDKCTLLLCKDFSEFVTSINSCHFFIGNMSSPLAIAHGLGKPHLGELFYPDQIHYIGDKLHLPDYFYIGQRGEINIDGLSKWINI